MVEQHVYVSSNGLSYALRRIGRRTWEVYQERENEIGVFDLWGTLRARHRAQLEWRVELEVNGIDWSKPKIPQTFIRAATMTANPLRLSGGTTRLLEWTAIPNA